VQGGFRILLGHAYLMQGDVDRAAKLAQEGCDLTRDTGYILSRGWGERLLALIAHTRGDAQGARAFLEQAIATFGSIGAAFEAARTHLLLARIAVTLGDGAAAARALATARDGFAALDVARYVRWTEALAARVDGAWPAPAAERLPRWA
jgi:hypothetical protein